MAISTDMQILALVITVLAHLVGAAVLLWGMIDHDDPDRGSWRDWWPRDDRGDGGPPPSPPPAPSGGQAVPVLPASDPAPRRVRQGGRIGDLSPKPARRPAHPPAPAPVPAHDRD